MLMTGKSLENKNTKLTVYTNSKSLIKNKL